MSVHMTTGVRCSRGNLAWLWAFSLCLSDCKCVDFPAVPVPSNGPLQDMPPPGLAMQGLMIEGPEQGAVVRGAWVAVTGWVDPAQIQDVLVVGAPIPEFYLPTGHVGVPTVAVTVRADGRFVAPRVPLEDGTNTLQIIAVVRGGATLQPVVRTVTAVDTAAIPATLVADPAQPEPGQPVTFRAATGESANLNWQWDVDGDGVYDQEGARATHTFSAAGHVDVTARTKVNGQWLCAATRVHVVRLPNVIASNTSITAPTRVFVIPMFAAPPFATDADGALDLEITATRFVAVVDGNAVKVFDAGLNPLFSLTGLNRPAYVAGDNQGRLYVADTGNNRVARFLATGALDVAFAAQGAFTGSTEAPVNAPVAVLPGADRADVVLSNGQVLTCTSLPTMGMTDAMLRDWTSVECDSHSLAEDAGFSALGLDAVTHAVARPSLLFADGARRPAFLVDSRRLVSMHSGSFVGVARMANVVDVALGRTAFFADAAEVDEQGRVHTYAQATKTGIYQLPYPVTAIGAGPNGALIVAGPGHLEARAFEALR